MEHALKSKGKEEGILGPKMQANNGFVVPIGSFRSGEWNMSENKKTTERGSSVLFTLGT